MKSRTIIVILIISVISISNVLYSQCSEMKIFDSTRTYIYNATFIDKNSDILTQEKIILQPLGIPWEYQKTQTKYKVTYYPTDSVVSNMRSPKSKKKKKWEGIRVSRKVTSGAIEDSLKIWMHPFRSNQYMYTEICAFPYIELDKLNIGEKWNGGKLFILTGWGKFKGKLTQTYLVEKQVDYEFQNTQLTDCWQIVGTGNHNKLGESSVRYIYHKEYGFLEFKYDFFDGTHITFKLMKIETNDLH